LDLTFVADMAGASLIREGFAPGILRADPKDVFEEHENLGLAKSGRA